MEGSSFKSIVKISARVLIRRAYKYLWYDIVSLALALDVSIILWLFFEFATIYYFMNVKNFPEEWGFFYYGVAHGFLLVLSEWIIRRTRERVEELQGIHGRYGLEFASNMSTWFEGYVASFSTALSFYVLAMIVLILNLMEPKFLKTQEVLQGQAFMALLIITYLPLTVALWINTRVAMYIKWFKIQESRLVPKEYQYNS